MYVIGVDGGTTKTIAMVADMNGRILAAARAEGSNWTGLDVEIPMTVVAKAVRDALQKANLCANDIATGVFTLAGADWPEDHIRRERFLIKANLAKRILVKNDSFGGLRAGLSRSYGMVLAVGTGMNAAVITPDGQEWAFGYYETTGGSSSICLKAFQAMLREEDGRGLPTLMTPKILACMGLESIETMLRAYVLQQLDRDRFYAITPLVFEAALEGDVVAAEIIVNMGKELAEYVHSMARRFNMCREEFEVVLAGSVFKGVGPLFVDTITQEIHRVVPRATIVRAKYEPVVGSILLAYDFMKMEVSEEIYQQLSKTVPGQDFFDTARGIRPTSITENND